MIDTTTNTTSTKLKIYKINFNNLFKNSLDNMINFLNTYNSCFPSTDITKIKPAMGLSLKEQKILIDTKENDDKLIAKSLQKTSYLDSDKTVAEWADEILTRYLTWLKQQYSKQEQLLKAPIDYTALANIIMNQPEAILFDTKIYLHDVANNLGAMSFTTLYILSFVKLSTIEQIYFYTEILTKLTNIPIIASSTISSLVDLISRQDNSSTLAIAILRLLQNIVNQQTTTIIEYDIIEHDMKNADSSTASTALLEITNRIQEKITNCIQEKTSQI